MPYYKYSDDKPILVSERTVELTPGTWCDNGKFWEPKSVSYFYAQVATKVDPVNIVDIGAQSGLYTLYAKYLPNATFYSYEPNPETFVLLQDNCKLNGITNVNLRNQGLGASLGNLKLKVPYQPHEKGLCSFGSNPLRFKHYEEKSVPVTTLDTDFFEKDIPIHFIKMDTEGWELPILQGGIQSLTKWKPDIFLEINDTNLRQCGFQRSQITDLLTSIGYTCICNLEDENYYFRITDVSKL
jgi:FkbM family methyltransferase